jgi:hypothetical protein
MSEIKNTFLRAKMNKDLDLRLVPNNEYIDALNVSVGKSETQNVGALQNILGNKILQKPSNTGTINFETDSSLVCIGFLVDNEKNRVYQFLTNYTDGNPSIINPPPSNKKMKITVYDPNNNGNPYVTLVDGLFLNFSTTNIITGVNLLENLLFWTDYRNQPRKINVDTAIANSVESGNPYYVNSEQLSVAKYSPFKPALLYSIIENINVIEVFTSEGVDTRLEILTADIVSSGLEIGCQLIDKVFDISEGDSAIVYNIVPSIVSGISYVYITGIWPSITAPTTLTFFKSTMKTVNPSENTSGNDNFLQDKFVRFSYRFKFDDNEISLMAPFTQPTFIPSQKGYFISGDEEAAYRSTVLEWMENSVNEVGLFIELPDTGNNVSKNYKIKSIDILYKESDSLAVKVVETINMTTIKQEFPNTNMYFYRYRSQKPKKTLQESETVRVSDVVPVKALAQEIAGNRVIYGNFYNQNTPPSNIDYNINIIDKDTEFTPFVSWFEYPNHTLKENRTYQVGFVLADKFGRESSVILSSAQPFISSAGISYSASSIFLPYKGQEITDKIHTWLGNQLIVLLNNEITSTRDETVGTPGLYATVSGAISGSNEGFQILSSTITGNTYTFELEPMPLIGTTIPQRNYPVVGKFLKGRYTDYVKVVGLIEIDENNFTITTSEPISDIYSYGAISPDVKYSYEINEMGWYSYKIVVKQQEQEYYNVYVPGMLAGYPSWQTVTVSPLLESDFPVNEDDTTCHFVLINDNINKVPRDLSEVGPNQKQYRSSVRLWTRVENALFDDSTDYAGNRQYYPTSRAEVVNTIATTLDLGFLPKSETNPDGSAFFNIYQFETTPLIGRVSTSNRVGVIGNNTVTTSQPEESTSMSPYLGVFETEPVVSAIDIFWETTTTGYISDLNQDVLTGSDAIIGYSDLGFLYFENQDYEGSSEITGDEDSPYITDWFYFKNTSGIEVSDIASIIFSVKNRNGDDVTPKFSLIRDTDSISSTYLFYRIKITQSDYYFGTQADLMTSFVFEFKITHVVGLNTYNPTITTANSLLKLSNIAPIITYPPDDTVFDLPNNPPVGVIVDCTGKNGTASAIDSNYLADLHWSFSSNENPSYFSIDNVNGDIRCETSVIVPGVYELVIKLKDSSNTNGIQTPAIGPLETEHVIYINVAGNQEGCSEWESNEYPTSPITPGETEAYNVEIGGSLPGNKGYVNFWRLLNPGETILNTSNVGLYKVQLAAEVEQTLVSPPALVTFAQGALYTGNGTFFRNNLRFTEGYKPGPVVEAFFQGYIRTSAGREIYVDFSTIGDLIDVENSVGESCTISYVPETIKGFTIFNNSTLTVIFSALAADGETIIGGNILPGGNAKSISQGGTYQEVRDGSISATGAVGLNVIITYI